MSKVIKFLSGMAVLTIAVTLSGCTGADDANSDGDHDAEHVHGEDCDHDHDAEKKHVHGDDDADQDHADDNDAGDASDDQAAAEKEKMLEGLSTEDRAAVERQQTCPVSDTLLWSMAKPYKTTVTGSDGNSREVFLCCEGCESKLKADPDKYLAKLGK